MNITLQHVHYMPKTMEPGILYVSNEFGTAAHLCACGCGSKTRTPLDVTEWQLTETDKGPTLYPSIGNWQIPCQSHYWIRNGEIVWSNKWTPQQILNGRKEEEERRRIFYENHYKEKSAFIKKWLNWLKKLLS